MERIIKFRGKVLKVIKKYHPIKVGEWAYGDLLHAEHDFVKGVDIITDSFSQVVVDENTVGQYTGACDAKDNPIYEGDILATLPIKNDFLHIVRFSDDTLRFDCIEKHHYINNPSFGGLALDHSWMKELNKVVIGNIHDNPELLLKK